MKIFLYLKKILYLKILGYFYCSVMLLVQHYKFIHEIEARLNVVKDLNSVCKAQTGTNTVQRMFRPLLQPL